MKDLNFEDMINYIYTKTGLDKKTIELVLDRETDYLIYNGFTKI